MPYHDHWKAEDKAASKRKDEIAALRTKLAEADKGWKSAHELLTAAVEDYNTEHAARTTAEAQLAEARKALEKIAHPETVSGMHEQDRVERLQSIARAALAEEQGE